jgi:hypothetical protein
MRCERDRNGSTLKAPQVTSQCNALGARPN